MNNRYKQMMGNICLSEQANTAFYEKLYNPKEKRAARTLVKATMIAACICLLIPTAVFAADSIFGLGIVEIVQRDLEYSGEPGIGLNINFENAKNRPITDFSEKWQTFEGFQDVEYDSWEDAQNDLGIDLADNSVLSSKDTEALRSLSYDIPDADSNAPRKYAHCYGSYRGQDGQLCFSRIMAAYWRDNATIFVTAIATVEHPTVSQEELLRLHSVEVTYRDKDVNEVSCEQYTAQNGLIATISTIDKSRGSGDNYEASFVADGISYRVTLYGNGKTAEDRKAMLIDILEGFTF